ncbi:MAG: tRNA (N(6)-L-threonylcarbamoyladenosine(37)-C(2))-methylthiotransferase MtaB [Campylobacteraceae bacterium]|jgi:MiaB-like tRNA modifying enzyme|nr:tRNA (N(6)-L-threonylcarbamoyladenosine(37)-C(2))-methylthiotransferase MtaB [Campylobacteraceae bacterium]
MNKVFFKTFGCRTNIYDTELIAANLENFQRVFSENEAEIVVVNSCTVTNSADATVRAYIKKMNSLNKRVIIAGCGALSKGESLKKSGLVFGVLGHSKKGNLNELLSLNKPFVQKGDLTKLDEQKSIKSDKTKAFIKIQEGCNFQCSYCIIPTVRGKARSYDEKLLLNQARELIDSGYKEIVLTGTNIGSYGKDKNSSLGGLLKILGEIDGLKRVRLGSIEPVQIDKEMLEVLSQNYIEKHLHIALQHTSSKMLKIMRRRNEVEKDLKLFEKLSSMGFALGTDYIVGHPGESDEVWNEALEWFKKFPLTHLHGFTFSKREGTISANMDLDVSQKVAKKRLKELKDIVFTNNLNFRKKHKEIKLEVLVEKYENGFSSGYDQFYNLVKIEGEYEKNRWLELPSYAIKDGYNEANF